MSPQLQLLGGLSLFGIIYILYSIYQHFFPTKPAFTTEGEYKKFLQLNEKQYNQIIGEAKQAMGGEVMKLLKERDKQMNDNLAETDAKIRNFINSHLDETKKIAALNATAGLKSYMFMLNQLYDIGALKDFPEDEEARQVVFREIYFKMSPEQRDLIFIKK